MLKVTLKGILAHKVRFLLTGVGGHPRRVVHRGHARAHRTINKTFDGLFTNVYANTDAAVREQGRVRRGLRRRPRPPRRLGGRARCRPPGRRGGGGDGPGPRVRDRQAQQGAQFRRPGRAGARASADIKDRDLSPFHVTQGHGPQAPNQIVIDKTTADKTKYGIGERRSPSSPRPDRQTRTSWSGSRSSATPTASGRDRRAVHARRPRAGVLGQPGKVDEVLVKADPGVSPGAGRGQPQASLAGDRNIEVLTGAQVTKDSQNDIKNALRFFSTFLLVFGVIALLVGVVHHLQHLLDHRGPARAGDGPAARDRARRAARSCGRCCSKPSSSVSSRPLIGFGAGVLLARPAQGAAVRARHRHPREPDHASRPAR